MGLRQGFDFVFLKAAHRYNLARTLLLRALLAGRLDAASDCDIWTSSIKYKGAGRTVIGSGASIERSNFPAVFEVEEGGEIRLGAGVWVRGKYRPNVLTCFAGGKIEIGDGSLLNGTVISARRSVSVGRKAMLSWNTAIIDSNLHPLCDDEPMEPQPVVIGDYVMIGTGVVVLPGARIGEHSVIGANSVVAGDVPAHTLAAGSPAKPVRALGDRSGCL